MAQEKGQRDTIDLVQVLVLELAHFARQDQVAAKFGNHSLVVSFVTSLTDNRGILSCRVRSTQTPSRVQQSFFTPLRPSTLAVLAQVDQSGLAASLKPHSHKQAASLPPDR